MSTATDTIEVGTDVDTETPSLAHRGPIEIRNIGIVADVSESKRLIELIAVPYDEGAVVEYPRGSGRLVVESFAPGSFDGVQTRTRRIPINRDHDEQRLVGKAVALHPSRSEGLVAEIRIAPTLLGDETLVLAADGMLDPSVGFGAAPSNQRVWQDGQVRRRHVLKAFLDHIALTAQQAYEGAQILALRSSAALAEEAPEVVVDPYADDVRAWLASMRSTSRA